MNVFDLNNIFPRKAKERQDGRKEAKEGRASQERRGR